MPPHWPTPRRDALDVRRGTARTLYAVALYMDSGATLDDLREAVNMLEDVERTARRVLGGAHPGVGTIEISLRDARRALRARDTPSPAGDA